MGARWMIANHFADLDPEYVLDEGGFGSADLFAPGKLVYGVAVGGRSVAPASSGVCRQGVVVCERCRQVAVGFDLCKEVSSLLLGCRECVSAGDPTQRWLP